MSSCIGFDYLKAERVLSSGCGVVPGHSGAHARLFRESTQRRPTLPDNGVMVLANGDNPAVVGWVTPQYYVQYAIAQYKRRKSQ